MIKDENRKKRKCRKFYLCKYQLGIGLFYGIKWKKLDFCINTIAGRYPEKGYCSNLECEELCYVLEGSGTIYKKEDIAIDFKSGDVIFINKKDIYYWNGNFKVAIVCTPAWSKEQCKLYDE